MRMRRDIMLLLLFLCICLVCFFSFSCREREEEEEGGVNAKSQKKKKILLKNEREVQRRYIKKRETKKVIGPHARERGMFYSFLYVVYLLVLERGGGARGGGGCLLAQVLFFLFFFCELSGSGRGGERKRREGVPVRARRGWGRGTRCPQQRTQDAEGTPFKTRKTEPLGQDGSITTASLKRMRVSDGWLTPVLVRLGPSPVLGSCVQPLAPLSCVFPSPFPRPLSLTRSTSSLPAHAERNPNRADAH
jgi:hypothetical protein